MVSRLLPAVYPYPSLTLNGSTLPVTPTPKNDFLPVASPPPRGLCKSNAVVYPDKLGVSGPNSPLAIVVYLALADGPSIAAVKEVLELLI